MIFSVEFIPGSIQQVFVFEQTKDGWRQLNPVSYWKGKMYFITDEPYIIVKIFPPNAKRWYQVITYPKDSAVEMKISQWLEFERKRGKTLIDPREIEELLNS